MTQYVLEVVIEGKEEDLGWLIRSFKVTVKSPIPSFIDPERQRLITEDTEMYEEAVAFYELHNKNAYYTIDGSIITWRLRD